MKKIKVVLFLAVVSMVAPRYFIAAQPTTSAVKEVSKFDRFNAALAKGDLATIKALIEADPTLINDKNTSSRSHHPLLQAVKSQNIGIIKYLLEQGANPNLQDSRTSILNNVLQGQYGIDKNWRAIADLLVANGADVNRLEGSGELLLTDILSSGPPKNRYEKVKWLLKNEADVTKRSRYGLSVLDYVFSRSDVEIETLKLLTENVNIKAHDNNGNTYLHFAAKKNDLGKVRFLIEKGVDVNAQNERGDTALHLIAPEASPILKVLLDAGANPNIKNERGDLPLHIALRRIENVRPNSNSSGTTLYISSPEGYTVDQETAILRETTIALLVNKTDLTIKDQYGLSPLPMAILARDRQARDLIIDKAPKMDVATRFFDAAASGNTATVTTLLAQKPFLVYFRLPDGSTPLHISALWGTTGVAQVLLKKGADPNARDSNAQTPLHRATTRPTGLFLRRAKLMMAFLISKKADLSAVDQNGKTVLHRAVLSEEIELVAELLGSHVKVDAPDESGFTPLMLSINRTAPIGITNLLINHGADVNARSRYLLTPLAIAVTMRRLDMVQTLVAKGADVTYKDTLGSGLLASLVEIHGSSDYDAETRRIFLFLLSKGADPNTRINNIPIASVLVDSTSEYGQELFRTLLATNKVPLIGNDYYGYEHSLLMQALSGMRQKEAFETLIRAGADLNEKDSNGRSILQIAISYDVDKTIIDMLKANGAVE